MKVNSSSLTKTNATRRELRRAALLAILTQTTSVTTPEPTVRPPSRMAKRVPGSTATDLSKPTWIVTESPGMHISALPINWASPVTSVVRKKNCGR